MSVYYKFKSAKDYDSVPMDGPFISVATLKEKIFESKRLGKGTDFDLVVTNAQTDEEYLDEQMLIPKNTSVLIRRVPGRPRMTIVTQEEPKVETNVPENGSFHNGDLSVAQYTEDAEWDEFGNDLYTIPEAPLVQPNHPLTEAPPTNKADEDSKLQALIDAPAFDWQRQGTDVFGGPGRGYGRGIAGRMGGRGFGFGNSGFEQRKPPEGYVCHRCKVPGHFIQHCPTNGDPNYDVKRVKPPTGIPKSMLIATPDGSYALPSGAAAVLKPNEAAFEREIEGLPSTRRVSDLPPELRCPLCNEVMKDAVLTSRCCFKSFCDKCIRDQIISKSRCVCGETNVLADHLLPNKTLRDTISRILENGGTSSGDAGSAIQIQDMESKIPQPKIPSPVHSIGSKGVTFPGKQQMPNVDEMVDEVSPVNGHQNFVDKASTSKVADASEATLESMCAKESTAQGNVPLVEEEVQQKLLSGEPGKKKKKKKARLPPNDLQWQNSQDLGAASYMTPFGPSVCNPYWSGMQPGMEGYMGTFAGGMPYMGPSGYNPYMDMPFGGGVMPPGPFGGGFMPPGPFGAGMMPPDPFGAQGFMIPNVPLERNMNFGMGMNIPPPAMSREEFEARKADLKRRRENERRGASKEFSRDRDFNTEVSGRDGVSSMKSKAKPVPQPSVEKLPRRPTPPLPLPERRARAFEAPPPTRRSAKRKSDDSENLNFRESERHRDRDDGQKDRDRDRELRRHHHRRSSEPSTKARSETEMTAAIADHDHELRHHHHRHRRSSEPSTKAQSETETSAAIADRKHKASVFSRISFPEGGEITKKHKHLSTTTKVTSDFGASAANHKSKMASLSSGGRKSSSNVANDYESSDDERHFKRKPSRYEPSPGPPEEWEEHARNSGDRLRKHR